LDTSIKTETRTTLFDCIQNKDELENQYSRAKEVLHKLDQENRKFEEQYSGLIKLKETLPQNPDLTRY
jgi:DNA repair exonuclease SbcCD ATPase subunit